MLPVLESVRVLQIVCLLVAHKQGTSNMYMCWYTVLRLMTLVYRPWCLSGNASSKSCPLSLMEVEMQDRRFTS